MTKKCLFLCVDGVRSDSILYANCENFRSFCPTVTQITLCTAKQ